MPRVAMSTPNARGGLVSRNLIFSTLTLPPRSRQTVLKKNRTRTYGLKYPVLGHSPPQDGQNANGNADFGCL